MKILKNKSNWIKIIGVVILTLFILSSLSRNTLGQDNYTNYLYNQPLTLVNDKAMILTEASYGGNNYRNYFESGFIFPAKLSNEMYNSYATDWTQYSFNQMYLDNLDNEKAFMSNNNSETIQEQIDIDKNALNYSYGSKIADSYTKLYYLFPDADIWANWLTTGSPHYQEIDEYPTPNEADYVYSRFDNSKHEKVNISDLSTSETYFNFNRIRVYMRWKYDDSQFSYIFCKLWYKDSAVLQSGQFFTTGSAGVWRTGYIQWNVDYNIDTINHFAFEFTPLGFFPIPPSDYIYICQLYMELREVQTTSVLESESDKISFNSTSLLPYANQTDDFKPVLLTFYYELCTNASGIDIFAYILDYDLEIYKLFDKIDYYKEFVLLSFAFNESALFRLNEFTINISASHSSSFKLFIKDFLVKVSYVKINELGYHEFSITYNKRNDGLTYKGYYQFNVKIFKTYFLYEYIEYNTDTDNYIISWTFINFSDTFDSIETFEINTHCRYGLNTLDIEITNIFIEIYINSFWYMDFLEQDRKFFDGKHYQTFFNYTCNNRNYLNLTGVFGNYSYNCLKGIRCLSGDDDLIFNRFFIVPLFQDNIDISQRQVSQADIDIPDEPDAPKDAPYWTYMTFKVQPDAIIYTDIGNWTIEFQQLEMVSTTGKFFYNPEAVSRRSLGDWRFKIGNDLIGYLRFDFNFVRDGLALLLNVMLLFLQYLLYLVVASLSFVFMWLGCIILLFLWNICVYWLWVGLCWVLWYMLLGLIYLWQLVKWLWENMLYPFLVWLWEVFVPILIEAFIIIWAHIITFIIWILTFAQADYWEIYAVVYATLRAIVDFAIEILLIIVKHILVIIIAIVLYLVLVLMAWLKHSYTKAKGYVNRTEQLRNSLDIYMTPINFVIDTAKKIYDILPIA